MSGRLPFLTGGPGARLPEPATTAVLGHLRRWTFDPVRLLTDGARTGEVFRLRLWRPVIVGYRPDWNRAVLSDLETFRSGGSLSDLTPYLSAGVVHTDVPEHDARRRQLNPHVHSRALGALAYRLAAATGVHPPVGWFDALAWSHRAVRAMLNAAFFAGRLPDRLLADFFAPLTRDHPAPLLPRPLLFRRVEQAIARVLVDPPPDTIGAALSEMDRAVEEIRVALAAGYDTTAHTLAWAVWHLAAAPGWRRPELLPLVVDETLRLYPAGWLGSRIAAHDTCVTGVDIPARTMVLYSPLLTHRDPWLWGDDAGSFRPERFGDGRPAWGFIPFSAGRRTCLGAHLARLMLRTALEPFCAGRLSHGTGDARIRAAITLRPHGPLPVRWDPP